MRGAQNMNDDRSLQIEELLLANEDPYTYAESAEEFATRGGELAHDWVVPAINGEEVPEAARTEFSYVDVQGGHGSANIPVLQAACAAWYWHHRNQGECNRVLQAWRGYMDLDAIGTKELALGVFRYWNWVMKGYVVMHALCLKRNEIELANDFAAYIRYILFTAVLTTGWRRGNNGYQQRVYPVAYAGARSWVAPRDSNGNYVERPYQGLTDWNHLCDDLSNMLESAAKAGWEVEPELRALKNKVNYTRWGMFTPYEKELCLRLISMSEVLGESAMADLHELCTKILETGAKRHIGIHCFKTTSGVALVCERSWASGSTSFKMGAIWDANGRIEGEYPESWAQEIPREWGWLQSGGHARRSDPGGAGNYELTQDRLRISAWTGDGSCGNGFSPGPDRHYEQWRGWVTDPDAWPQGVREISLPGDLLWHVHIKAKGRGIDILHPDDSEIEPPTEPPTEPPPVEPPPTEPPPASGCPPEVVGPGAEDLVYAHDQLVRAMRNWGSSKGDNQSRRSRDAIDDARRKMYG